MYTTEVSWQVVSEPKENKGRLARGAAAGFGAVGAGEAGGRDSSKTGGASPRFRESFVGLGDPRGQLWLGETRAGRYGGAVRQEGALGDLGMGLLVETAGLLCGGHRHSQRRR